MLSIYRVLPVLVLLSIFSFKGISQAPTSADTAYLQGMYVRAAKNIFVRPNNGLATIDSGLLFIDSMEMTDFLWKFYVIQGLAYKTKEKYDSTLLSYDKAKDNLPTKGNLEAFLIIQHNTAAVYQEQYNQLDSALAIYKESLARNDTSTLNLKRSYAGTCSNIGLVYKNQDKYEDAIEYFKEGIDFARRNQLNEQQATLLLNWGTLCSDIGDFKCQLEMCRKAFKLLQGKERTAVFALAGLSNAHGRLGNPDSAIHYSKLKLAHPTLRRTNRCSGLLNIATAYFAKGDIQQARDYIREALDREKGCLKPDDLADAYTLIGHIEYDEGKYGRAINYFQLADSLYRSVLEVDLRKEIVQNMERWVAALILGERSRQAGDLYVEYVNFRDSVYRSELSATLEELRIEYESELLQDSLQQLALREEVQSARARAATNFAWVLALLAVVAGLLSVLLWKRWQLEKAERKELEEQLEELAEISASETDIAEQTLVIPGNEQRIVAFKEILYVQAANNAVKYNLEDGETIWAWQTLKACNDDLPESLFLRIHRSHLINLSRVRSINGEKVTMDDGHQLRISRSYRPMILDRISSFYRSPLTK